MTAQPFLNSLRRSAVFTALILLFVSAEAVRSFAQIAVLTAEERGKVVNRVYRNEKLGFHISPIKGWDMFSAGQLNVVDAMVHGAARLKSEGAEFEHHRVLGIINNDRDTIFVALGALTKEEAGKSLKEMVAGLKQKTREAFPGMKELPDTIRFGDANHEFVAYRIRRKYEESDIYQCQQLTVMHGYLVVFAVTAKSPQAMDAALKALRSGLVFDK